jgi:hypothetical protein
MLRHAVRIALLAAFVLGGLFAAFGLPSNAVDVRQMIVAALVLAAIVYGGYVLSRPTTAGPTRVQPARPGAPDAASDTDERARSDVEWEEVQGPRYRMTAAPSRRSCRVRIELRERLAVYRNELETHVISAAEIPRALLVLGPPRWETADSDEIARELWKSLMSLYARFRNEWVESGDVNYPVVWRASFRILADAEDAGDVADTYRFDANGELSCP